MLKRIVNLVRLAWLYVRYRRSTMVRVLPFIDNLRLVQRALENPACRMSGCIVECGTWRGGMSAALMSVGGSNREYFFFDSFKGLPPPGLMDGGEAIKWALNKNGTRYFNNCCASLAEFTDVIKGVPHSPDLVHVVSGLFSDSFQKIAVPPIVVLRLDADWYDSTLRCLEKFWGQVVSGGLIIIDDYYDWEGCRKAVHEFLSRQGAREAIRQTAVGKVAFIWKT